VIFIFVSSARADVDLEMDTSAKCFSCMSEIYETMWSEIDGVYKKPKDFTDECNAENISPTLVRTISCPHVCVSIKEDIKVGGMCHWPKIKSKSSLSPSLGLSLT
jgi:hypothetical protein